MLNGNVAIQERLLRRYACDVADELQAALAAGDEPAHIEALALHLERMLRQQAAAILAALPVPEAVAAEGSPGAAAVRAQPDAARAADFLIGC
jgi:hypothetical protein